MAKDWTEGIDWSKASENVASDIRGDWYRDPWGWPEYDYLLSEGKSLVHERARSTGIRRVARIDVPKSNFATRPAVVMEPLDRLVFQGITDCVSKKLIGNTADFVFGWRLERESPASGNYVENDDEWGLYRANLQRLVSVADLGLRTDIVSCFASIPTARVTEDVERLAGRNAMTARLGGMLEAFSRIPDRAGIPQRSLASCVLANMYLARLDGVLSRYESESSSFWKSFASGKLVTRWMDDMWVFGWEEEELRSVQYDLQNEARSAGLELNSAKTEVLEGEQLAAEALRVEHSAVDAALNRKAANVEPLEELIDKILENPAQADRTSIRFAMTRMRRSKVSSRLVQLAQAANRMPQGADHLARAFRDFNIWSNLQEWFLEYETSLWARNSWAASQLGTMFPSKGKVLPAVEERFAKILEGRPELPMLALTAQRLAGWRPEKAREAMRALAKIADQPLERRILALAGLQIREESVYIRGLLSEYQENDVTLKAIEARSFKPFDLEADFATRS